MNEHATVQAAQADEQTIKNALNAASVAVLRIALYHQTKDPFLANMPVEERQVRGGALSTFVVPREYHDAIREKAFEFLTSDKEAKPAPTREQAAELMAMYSGHTPTPAELNYGYEELSFDEFPRNTTWKGLPPKNLEDFSVTIIGAGFSGMAAAIQLDRLGIKYRIIERHPNLGGTWHVNDYPEARVDVPTFSYQYKFEKNYPWKSFFAPCDELREYAEHIAEKYKIKPNISFNTSLQDAKWNEQTKHWDLTLSGPDQQIEQLSSNIVISAAGLFGTAKLPDIPGIERYQGKIFHTTQWDHSFDYADKKVAVIGTGSTGTQLARGIALEAEKLTVFQRTANWVTPVTGYHAKVPGELRWLFDNMPGYLNWFIYANYFSELKMQDLHELDPEWIAKGGKVNEKNQMLRESLTEFIRSKVGDDNDMFEKLIPTHSPVSRRLVIDNAWYDTLMRDNTELVTCGIKEITETGIIDNEGVEHEFDLIVLGAGFKVSQYLWPVRYEGRDGQSIEEFWAEDGARAFKGMAMPGFPNFFMIYGPNAQARAGSFHSVVEVLSRYITGLVTNMLEQGSQTVEVSTNAFEEYNHDMDEATSRLLWEDEMGGGGYYINEHGRSGVNMPWRLHEFYEMVRKPDNENYKFE